MLVVLSFNASTLAVKRKTMHRSAIRDLDTVVGRLKENVGSEVDDALDMLIDPKHHPDDTKDLLKFVDKNISKLERASDAIHKVTRSR